MLSCLDQDIWIGADEIDALRTMPIASLVDHTIR